MRGALWSYSMCAAGVLLCFGATFGRLAFYQCDFSSCTHIDENPVPKFFMYLWAGFSIPAWSLGLGIIMILCFQRRFIPLLQDVLCLGLWQPLAKLSFAAYLI